MTYAGKDGTKSRRRRRLFRWGSDRFRLRLHGFLLIAALAGAILVEVVRGHGVPDAYDPGLAASFRAGRLVAAVLFFLVYLAIVNWSLLSSARSITSALIWAPALVAVALAVASIATTVFVFAGELLASSGPGPVTVANADAALDGASTLVPTAAVLMAILPFLVPLDIAAQLPSQMRTRGRAPHEDRDAQTGLPSRREMIRRVAEEMDRSRRYSRPFSIALVDLDGFVTFQMEHGAEAEEEVLHHLGQLLPKLSRNSDRVGRWDTSEFLAVLPETPEDGALLYGRRVRESIEEYGYGLANRFHGRSLTASIGVAIADGEEKSAEDLIRKAQVARIRARTAGGNGCELWRPGAA